MKTISLFTVTFLGSVASLSAAINVTQSLDADNVGWPDVPAISVGGTELYDARSLTIEGASGLAVESVRIFLDTSGTFDDSIAMDIDGDGTIDFATTQDDAYNTAGIGSGVYAPWVDASPYTFDAVITATGTTLASYWNGVEIIQGAGSGAAGFNNAAGFTLEDWGFNAGGIIPSADFTTGVMRLGNLNTDGISGHDISFSFDAVVILDTDGNQHVFDPDGDGVPSSVPSAVPEPGTVALLMGMLAFGLTVWSKRRSL